jgi:hypothetical protein
MSKFISDNQQIKATCAILDLNDNVLSERLIGYFDSVDEASFAAFKERQDNECVCIYNAPADEEYELSALEIAELEVVWNEIAGN